MRLICISVTNLTVFCAYCVTGTVCIGTFGLRGSVTNDNAAAAIDAAGAIIMQLHKIGIAASIGMHTTNAVSLVHSGTVLS